MTPASIIADTRGGLRQGAEALVIAALLLGLLPLNEQVHDAHPSLLLDFSGLATSVNRLVELLGTGDIAIGTENDRAHRRIRIRRPLHPLGLLEGQAHRGLDAGRRHSRRCRDARPARRRNASTAAAGSSAL